MTFRSIENDEVATRLRDLPVLAVDLGFSAKKPTCGFLTFPEDSSLRTELVYSDLVAKARGWLEANSPAVLILEAPLSGGFDIQGNPVPRGEFERLHSETKKSSPRHWNVMAGASMALAAIHFCHALSTNAPKHITVYLLEGFASRYTDDEAMKPGHVDVARELIRRWRARDQFAAWDEGVQTISVTQILNGSRSDRAPAVLRIPDNFAVIRRLPR